MRSHAAGLDRNELGAFLVAAGLSSPRHHALCSLLARADRTTEPLLPPPRRRPRPPRRQENRPLRRARATASPAADPAPTTAVAAGKPSVCVDDATRLAYVEVLPNELATTVACLARAIAWFAERGVTVGQVMTDNGSPYRSIAWAPFCAARGIDHIRTRPYRPRTNGKAERFLQTVLREWAWTPPPTATPATAPETATT